MRMACRLPRSVAGRWQRRRLRFAKLEEGTYTPGLDFLKLARLVMPRVCYFTGKKTSFGNQITHRGKAKYLGGVGTKVTGVTSRKFRPNIQKVRALIDGQIVRIKVSTKAIRNGLVIKPVKRRYKAQPANSAA